MEVFDRFFRVSPEELRAAEFLNYGRGYSSHLRESLHGHSDVLDHAIENIEFLFYSLIVALASADFAAIIKYGPGSPKAEKLLGLMIQSAEKVNPHIRKNLMYHKGFLDAMESEGRLHKDGLTIPQASGCWVLMALVKQNRIDLDDPQILEAGQLLGDSIYQRFRSFWDEIG